MIYELVVDADRNIANRAFEYLITNSIHSPISKVEKKNGIPEKSIILFRVIQYLEKYSTDENEIDHVYFFVKNCAGNAEEIVNEFNKDVLNVEEMTLMLLNQQNSFGFTGRQLHLLVVDDSLT